MHQHIGHRFIDSHNQFVYGFAGFPQTNDRAFDESPDFSQIIERYRGEIDGYFAHKYAAKGQTGDESYYCQYTPNF